MAERGTPGGLGFEGLLRGIGDLLHQAANISSDLKRNGAEGQKPQVEVAHVRPHHGRRGGRRGFLRPARAGRQCPGPSRRGGRRPRKLPPPPPPERREATIDVLPEPDWILAVVELPGAAADSIRCHGRAGHAVDQRQPPPASTTAAEALLPCAVEDAAREQSFRNGVLELRWPRARPQT